MLIENYKQDSKLVSRNSKVADKRNFLAPSPYPEYRNDKSKYKEYLPRLGAKIKLRINDPQQSQLSHTKTYTSQPSKICKTEASQSSKHYNQSTIYSQKPQFQFTKTQKTRSHQLWQHTSPYQKQPQNINITSLVSNNNQVQIKQKSDSRLKTHYQQRALSKTQQNECFSSSHQYQTQTFQQNIIRNRLKIKNSHQMQQQTRFNSTLHVKSNERYRTQIYELDESKDDIGPSRLDTHTDFRYKINDKTNINSKLTDFIKNKQTDFAKARNKNKKSNLYVPSFNRHKITPSTVQNLIKKIQLQSQLKNYQSQAFEKQILLKIPEENHKLQNQIQKIELYFKTNKKEWFSHHLQAIIKSQSKNLNDRELFSKTNQRSRSEKIGKIVRQITNRKIDNKKNSQSLYSDERFEQLIESQRSEEGTVVLHDNSYRKEMVHIDLSSTDQNQTILNAQSIKTLPRVPSDQLILNAEHQLIKDPQISDLENQQSKMPSIERPKSIESGKGRNSNNRRNKKSDSRDQCLIF